MRALTRLVVLGAGFALAAGCGYTTDRLRDFGECFRFEVGAGPGLGVSVRGAGLLDLGATVACTPRLTSVGWRYGDAWAFGFGDNARAWDAEVDITAPVDAAAVAVVIGTVAVMAMTEKLAGDLHHSVDKTVSKAIGHVGENLPRPPRPHGAAVHVVPVIPIVPRHRGGGTEPAPEAEPQPPPADDTRAAPVPHRPPPTRTTFGLHWIIEGSPRPTLNPALATHTSWQLLPCLMNFTYEPLPDAFPTTRGWVETRDRGWVWAAPATRRDRVHAFDLEASVYAGVVYTRIGFSPGEFVDFLAGLVGLDPAGDDRYRR